MSYGQPLRTLTYARKLKHMKPGPRTLQLRGKSVKVMLEKDGCTLRILSAPSFLVSEIQSARTMKVEDGRRLQPVDGHTKKTAPKTQTPKTQAPTPPVAPPAPAPAPAKTPVKEVKPVAVEQPLSEKDRKKAMLVPVPSKGTIPTPYVDWSKIPEFCKVSGIMYEDYPSSQAPKGMLHELREMFKRSRVYQDTAPVNVLIKGWKGSGKSELIKAFAENAGLPYWSIVGQEGIRAEELLGHKEIVPVETAAGVTNKTVWVDGIIPRAVRAGGILHIDEGNVLDPAILMRLDELLDNKRQLNMEDYNGEIIKAHPDLFIVFTMNPETFEGVKPLPEPITSRLTKRYQLNYPPPHIEMEILKFKMNLTDAEFKPPTTQSGMPTGKYAKDIADLMKIIGGSGKGQDLGLRGSTELSYTPSMRETQAFVQDLREGDSFEVAFNRNIRNLYWDKDLEIVDSALHAVGRRV